MASPHPFHERPRALSDTAAVFFFARSPPARSPPAPSLRALAPYARSPLAVSFDSMVKMAS